jgi:hypothetical protein
MNAGGRAIFVGFGLAVAAAIGAVAWLVLSGGPSTPLGGASTVAPSPVGVDAPPEPGPGRPPHGGTRPSRDPRPAPSLEITGIVVDAGGEPVVGATVGVFLRLEEGTPGAAPDAEAERVDPDLLMDLFALYPDEVAGAAPYTGVPALPEAGPSLPEEARGTSADDGTFRIKVSGRGTYRVHASKRGAGSAATDEAKPGGPAVTLRLGPSAPLEGRVVRIIGSIPVEGATVVVRSGSVEKGAVTGPGGLFSVEDLPPGKYSVTAGAPGLAPTTLSGVEIPSTTGPLEVLLGGGHTIVVKVMKWEDPPPGWRRTRGNSLPPGPPIAGARVVLFRARSDTYLTALTGSDGVARFERLGEGFWRVGAWKEGYLVGSGGRDVRFKAGSLPEESREVRLEPAVPMVVRVMDEGGAPLANAPVYFGGQDEEFDQRHSRMVGRTDAEGKLTVVFDEGVPAKSVVWIVPENGGAAVMVEPEDFEEGIEVKAVVPPGRVVKGRVTDTKGKPIAGAELYLTVYQDEMDLDLGLFVYSDADGNYAFPPVPFGESSLDVDWVDDWDTVDFEEDDRRSPLVQDFTLERDEDL